MSGSTSVEAAASGLDEAFGGLTLRQLGAGAVSRCFLVERADGTLVVHKRIPVSHLAAADQELAEREVNILAALNHPSIIRYHRAFVRHGELCIIMEHASGGDLSHHLAELRAAGQRLDGALALDWFVQLLLALDYVHAHKVLHRDVALKNVFLAGSGLVKLGDFGVARVLVDESALTKVGTPTRDAGRRGRGARREGALAPAAMEIF